MKDTPIKSIKSHNFEFKGTTEGIKMLEAYLDPKISSKKSIWKRLKMFPPGVDPELIKGLIGPMKFVETMGKTKIG